MNIIDIEQDVKRRESLLQNLEYSLAYLKQVEKDHNEAIKLLDHEIFFVKDQLFNYRMLLNILIEDQEIVDEVPKSI